MLRIFRNDLVVFFETPPTDVIVRKLIGYLQELNQCMKPDQCLKACRNLQSTMRSIISPLCLSLPLIARLRVLNGYVSVLQIMLHGIYSPLIQSMACVKALEALWEEASNFINIFCSDNPTNQKVLHPSIVYLIEGVNSKFSGYPYVIHVRSSSLRIVVALSPLYSPR
jgi:hypothetical protein